MRVAPATKVGTLYLVYRSRLRRAVKVVHDAWTLKITVTKSPSKMVEPSTFRSPEINDDRIRRISGSSRDIPSHSTLHPEDSRGSIHAG
jgi:hypothetical protein